MLILILPFNVNVKVVVHITVDDDDSDSDTYKETVPPLSSNSGPRLVKLTRVIR